MVGCRFRLLIQVFAEIDVPTVIRVKTVVFIMTSCQQKCGSKPSRKATLYCFNCAHESPIGGDWRVQAHGEHVDYTCPECETKITSRQTNTNSAAQTTRNQFCCPGD